MSEPQIDKRKVTMRSTVVVGIDPDSGLPQYQDHVAVDYVGPEILDQYVENARKTWQLVTVSDEPDAGPGGYHGETFIPEYVDHPLAGQLIAATTPED